MANFGEPKDNWTCPNDRELVLRSRLRTGWSVRSHSANTFVRPSQITEAEKAAIKSVIDRSERIDKREQERIGRLVERVEVMKKNAIGNGESQCVLCAEPFSRLRSMPMFCIDCKKAVCAKCGVEQFMIAKDSDWLCKICAESREMWKKSGAWFYKILPKYVLPTKKKWAIPIVPQRTYESCFARDSIRSNPLSQGRLLDERESTDSSDDDAKIPKATIRLSKRLCAESKTPAVKISKDVSNTPNIRSENSVNSLYDPIGAVQLPIFGGVKSPSRSTVRSARK